MVMFISNKMGVEECTKSSVHYWYMVYQIGKKLYFVQVPWPALGRWKVNASQPVFGFLT